MHKKFQVNQTKIKGGCQSETIAAHCFSCTDLTLGLSILREKIPKDLGSSLGMDFWQLVLDVLDMLLTISLTSAVAAALLRRLISFGTLSVCMSALASVGTSVALSDADRTVRSPVRINAALLQPLLATLVEPCSA